MTNPYDSPRVDPATIAEPTRSNGTDIEQLPPHFKPTIISYAVTGLFAGFLIWFAIFIFQGEFSEFGSRLTHLYGRDLTARNTDWQYLALITVAVTIVAFEFAGAATNLVDRTTSVQRRLATWARVIRAVLFAVIVCACISALFYYIATRIGVSPAPPVLVATLMAGLTAVAVAKLTGPQIELRRAEHADEPEPMRRYRVPQPLSV